MNSEKDLSIAEGLRVDEEWALINRHRIEKSFNVADSISEMMIDYVKELRKDMLNDEETSISDYEKKIMLTGFHIGIELSNRKNSAILSVISEHLLSPQKFGDPEKED